MNLPDNVREIPGYPGYFVSEEGEVHSTKKGKHIILKKSTRQTGYFNVGLVKDGKCKGMSVHRLVASAWCENDDPKTKIWVHHMDHNKKNNHRTNLEWCTPSHNSKMNFITGGRKGVKSYLGRKGRDCSFVKLIRQCHPEDGVVGVYWGLEDASNKSGASQAGISMGLREKRPIGGQSPKSQKYIWNYVFPR